MKLSEQQALILFDIAKYACQIQGGIAGYTHETIEALINAIIAQQSNVPQELDAPSISRPTGRTGP